LITDTHAHVWWDSYDSDRSEVLARARTSGVGRMVMVGTDLSSSRAAFDLAAQAPDLFPTAGMHPHDASDADAATRDAIEALCEREECVAVGETGMDLFRNHSPLAAQEDCFRWQIRLSQRLRLPLIIHCRDAHLELSGILQAEDPVRGVMHCFSMGMAELPTYLDLDLFISFSGILTYPRNDALREVASSVPEERILVETDCPFLAPQGHRGRRNEPAFITETVLELARLRGVTSERIAEITSANAATLFGFRGQA